MASLLLTACESIGYYSQAVGGQFSVFRKRQDIESLIVAPDTDPVLQQKLSTILDIREFAEQTLALPVKNNFSTYVDLERPFALWNVFAAPVYSLEPRHWCYPVAGCVSYRGYFNKDRAYAKAGDLADEGWDVYVGGVTAYSTLGWFSDPVLNTIIEREDYRLASLIFHELAHQVVYVKDDTEFNESFATTVEREGLRRWLASEAFSDSAAASIQAEADDALVQQEAFVALVQEAAGELQELYDAEQDEAVLAAGKARIQHQLRNDYQVLKADWGHSPYDGWMSGSLNNAQLLTVSTYNALVPAFKALLQENNNDLSAFYEEVEALAKLPPEQRRQHLK